MSRAEECAYVQLADWPADDRKRWNRVAQHPRAANWKSPRTHQVYEDAYGHYLGFLVASGYTLGALPRAGRVIPEKVEKYATYLLRRVRPTTAEGRVRALCWMAPIFSSTANYDDFRPAVRFLRRLAEKAPARKPVMSHKAARRLGFKLMEKAQLPSAGNPRQRAALFRDGLMLACLSYRPFRRRVFSELEFGKTLVEQHSDRWMMMPKGEQSFYKRAYAKTWPEDLLEALAEYVRTYRPMLLGTRSHDFLWVSYRGAPLAPRSLLLAVARRTKSEFGIRYGVHDFRTAVGTAAPNTIEAAKRLDNSVDVAAKSYVKRDATAVRIAHIQALAKLDEEGFGSSLDR